MLAERRGSRDDLWLSLASSVAIAAAAAHALLFLSLHVLEPGLRPAASVISDYARTGHAGVATAAFLAFGVVWGSLAIALAAAPRARTITVGRVLFGLALLAIVFAALFPATADPRTGSAPARVQNLIARPGLFLGVILVSTGLRSSPGWRDLGGRLLSLALVAAVLLVLTVAVLLDAGLGGLGQRAIFVLLYLWVWLVARRTLRNAAGT